MSTKNIIIDARMVDEHLHGIGRYTYELIKGISNREDFNVKLIVNDTNLANKIFKDNKVTFIEVKSKFLSLTEVIELPLKINKYKDYIYHTPSFSCSPFIKLQSYMTLHDLNHLALPQYYSKIHTLYYKFIVKPFANKCKKIFTVSEFSKGEILKWLECNEDKVIVTYNGIDEKFKPITNKDELDIIKKKYRLPDQFVLYIGNQKPHKNLETLVKAMKDVNSILILNGKPCDSIQNLINKMNLEDKVKFIGYVDDCDLPYLYNLANIFVFPSLYEGFGLPPLEAMACGCKTIVADSTALPEIVGNCAIKFETLNVNELSNKINSMGSEEYDIKAGISRSKIFSWDNMVNDIVNILSKEESEDKYV
ncbi:glycosyltransferase family 4 protein [Clostridium baratii]|uniref:glycosyltransferase family 4 protein n=1 Tax=Clostridium baratii TaxID=1561 RepID=UPI0030D5DEA8